MKLLICLVLAASAATTTRGQYRHDDSAINVVDAAEEVVGDALDGTGALRESLTDTNNMEFGYVPIVVRAT